MGRDDVLAVEEPDRWALAAAVDVPAVAERDRVEVAEGVAEARPDCRVEEASGSPADAVALCESHPVAAPPENPRSPNPTSATTGMGREIGGRSNVTGLLLHGYAGSGLHPTA